VIGQRINNFEIVEQIGEGGMGAVYMARHPFIDRKVAVKVLRASLANDPEVVNRFFNEAKAANAIRHPNIIDILDVGLLPDGRTPYLMMELLEGESVSKRLKRGLMSPEAAVEVALQTAAAVSAAHAKGIVHRDLKPENLFLIPDPKTGKEVLKVLDFGIAKLRGTLSGDAVRTQTGALMGTPPYMSPEQCRGISGEVDHRTDVYALGIILYEMLCGSPPFIGEGFGDVLVQHLTQAPEPPRRRNPIIPVSLEKVILRALAKTTAQRYATMGDLQAALEGKAVPEPDGPAEPMTTSAKMAVAQTTAMPFQRQTTTLSANTGELEDDVESVPKTGNRRLLLGGVGGLAAAAAVALLFGLRSSPSPVSGGHAAAGDRIPVAVTHPPPPPALKADAGAAPAVAKVAKVAKVEETPPPPQAKKPPVARKPAPPPRPRTHAPESDMGKW
jgi:serine/threonine protein kinase